MATPYNYRTMIPWFELEALLKERLSQAYIKLGNSDDKTFQRDQGRVRELQELLNLPEILSARADDKEQEEKERAKAQQQI